MGFFSDIKSLFKADLAGQYDPAGRYLASVIKAVADQEESFLPALLGTKSKAKLTCGTEYQFWGGERRADLAVYEDGSYEPVHLVEVKVFDNKDNDHTRGQFKDYQKWAEIGNKRKVFVISPFGLPDAQMRSIRESGNSIKLIDLSAVAAGLNTESGLIPLFVEYIKDAGYIMKNIDNSRASAFTHFLISAFLPHKHGLGGEVKNSSERVSDGPLVFSDIVSNFQLFIQTFPSKPKKPTVQYTFTQALKAARVRKENGETTEYIFKVKDEEDESNKFIPSRRLKVGGHLSIYAYCPLGDSFYLSIGIRIKIGKDNDENEPFDSPITYGTYVEIYKGNESVAYEEADIDVPKGELPKLFRSQHEANKEFKKLVKKLVAQLHKSKTELVAQLKERLPSELLS